MDSANNLTFWSPTYEYVHVLVVAGNAFECIFDQSDVRLVELLPAVLGFGS
jgi:hypothetical protein